MQKQLDITIVSPNRGFFIFMDNIANPPCAMRMKLLFHGSCTAWDTPIARLGALQSPTEGRRCAYLPSDFATMTGLPLFPGWIHHRRRFRPAEVFNRFQEEKRNFDAFQHKV